MAKKLGRVTHYYDGIGVAIVELEGPLKLGDELVFKRGDVEVATQTVESIQINKSAVENAKKGDVIGLHMDEPVKPGAVAYI